MKTTIIGIAGGSASGKTTLAKNICQLAKPISSVTLIRLDDYYKNYTDLSFEERKKINFDHPSAYDFDLLIEHINLLKQGIQIPKPTYDFIAHNRSDITEIVQPANVIIVEGIMLFAVPQLCNIFDIKIFVQTPDDIRFIRRLQRDINERGRDINNVINQYTTTVRPMHHQFVEPSKQFADIIIPEGGENEVAIDIIFNKIKNLIEQ
ncbi:MAG: uridine kinase [Bacilli bacterium]|nr:uridine kinase [Bacilli bacterium]